MSLLLFYIRHGETEWSLTHRHTGRTDISLTGHGENQASQLGKKLVNVRFNQIFTSPSQRAQRTCALVGATTPAAISEDLAEWNYGDYEGRCTVDIRKERPSWNIFQDGCPGGETSADISARADLMITRLLNLSGKVALFSHGQFGRVLAARWIGLPAAEGQHLALDPASISILGFELNYPQRRVISLWNAAPANLPHSA